MLDSLEVLLRDVGDLRGGSVPGVHQHGVVWPEEDSQLSSPTLSAQLTGSSTRALSCASP